MTVPTDEHFDFELQSAAVSECADDSAWAGDDVVKLDDAEVAEIQAGDDKPFHVEFVALYEGLSRNNKVYGPDAIKSCVDAMIGVNMYKGHVEPGTASWKYREPVGRVVAAKLEKINVGGKDVLAAKGKAYITEGDPKLRSDIKKKMAGNVSILGNARMVRKFGETTKTVTEFHKPLKSVDFCNPDTGGLSHAGVTAVVSEMAATVTETETDPNATDHEDTKMAKMTKAELLAEYKAEITELVGEQIEEQIQEIADGRRELATERVDMKAKLEEKDGEVAEMKTERDAAVTERDDYKAKFEQERDARIRAEVTAFAAEHVAAVLAIGAGEVAVCSTGLIGERLPMQNLLAGVDVAAGCLHAEGGDDAARAAAAALHGRRRHAPDGHDGLRGPRAADAHAARGQRRPRRPPGARAPETRRAGERVAACGRGVSSVVVVLVGLERRDDLGLHVRRGLLVVAVLHRETPGSAGDALEFAGEVHDFG